MPIELAEGQNDDLLQSEWAKSCTRAAQEMEEILLLHELGVGGSDRWGGSDEQGMLLAH